MSSENQQNLTPDNAHLAVLIAMSDALHFDGELISQYPEIIWQQVYNRLQGKEEPISHILVLVAPAKC